MGLQNPHHVHFQWKTNGLGQPYGESPFGDTIPWNGRFEGQILPETLSFTGFDLAHPLDARLQEADPYRTTPELFLGKEIAHNMSVHLLFCKTLDTGLQVLIPEGWEEQPKLGVLLVVLHVLDFGAIVLWVLLDLEMPCATPMAEGGPRCKRFGTPWRKRLRSSGSTRWRSDTQQLTLRKSWSCSAS